MSWLARREGGGAFGLAGEAVIVMLALVASSHVSNAALDKEGVDGRDKPDHNESGCLRNR